MNMIVLVGFLFVCRPHLLAVQIGLLRLCSNILKSWFYNEFSINEKLAGIHVHDHQSTVDVFFQMRYG